MRNYRKLIIIAMVFGLTMVANSTVFAGCGGNVCSGLIDRLYTDSAGTLFIATDGDESKLTNCTSPLGVYVTMSASDSNFDRKYAMMLTAFSLGKSIGLRTVDSSPSCAVSYVFVDN